jgi:hypothetical protein
MWWIVVACVVIVGICFVQFFGNYSIKKGWYDDYKVKTKR